MSAATYYAITVDTEEEWDWSSGFSTDPTTVQNIGRLTRLQRICDVHGAAVTYFVNHAVLSHPESRATIQALSSRPNVEIGAHIHPWNTPPLSAGREVPVRESFLHNLPRDLQEAKLRTVLRSFEECEIKPRSFRGGRYSTSPLIQAFLQRAGIRADCSVLPYNTWPDDGAPDYRDRDLSLVRLEPRSGDEATLWELPLTFGYSRRPFWLWHRLCEWLQAGWIRWSRAVGVLDRLGIIRRRWLNFEYQSGEDLLPFLELIRKLRLPFVCFTLHSSSLLPGGNPYAPGEEAVELIFARIERTLTIIKNWPEFKPATILQTVQHLESQHHACHRHQSAG